MSFLYGRGRYSALASIDRHLRSIDYAIVIEVIRGLCVTSKTRVETLSLSLFQLVFVVDLSAGAGFGNRGAQNIDVDLTSKFVMLAGPATFPVAFVCAALSLMPDGKTESAPSEQ